MVDAAAVCVIIGILGLNIPGGIKCLSDKYELSNFLSNFLWIYSNMWRIHLYLGCEDNINLLARQQLFPATDEV